MGDSDKTGVSETAVRLGFEITHEGLRRRIKSRLGVDVMANAYLDCTTTSTPAPRWDSVSPIRKSFPTTRPGASLKPDIHMVMSSVC